MIEEVMDGVRVPPLKARLHRKYVTTAELMLLVVAVEHCSDGSTIWASVRRLAVYSKLSRRTVQSLLRKFEKKRWFTMLAPANCEKQMPASYRLNEHAIPDDPRMGEFIAEEEQFSLPGVYRKAIPGEKIPDRTPPRATTAQGYQDVYSRATTAPGATTAPNPLMIDDLDLLNSKIINQSPDPRAITAQGGSVPEDRKAYVHEILEAYRQTTGGKITQADVQLAAKLADTVPLEVVKTAFSIAAMRRRDRRADAVPLQPIRSLAYFEPTIAEVNSGAARRAPDAVRDYTPGAVQANPSAASAGAVREAVEPTVTCKKCGFKTLPGCRFCPSCRQPYEEA